PRPHSTPPSFLLASTIAPTTALKCAAARMFGMVSRSRPTVAPRSTGCAKSSARALLARDFSGYVRTPDRSNSSYENGIALALRLRPTSGRACVIFLHDQHRIAVAVKPIPFGDRVIVCVQHALAAGEGGDEHQQRGLR